MLESVGAPSELTPSLQIGNNRFAENFNSPQWCFNKLPHPHEKLPSVNGLEVRLLRFNYKVLRIHITFPIPDQHLYLIYAHRKGPLSVCV